MTSTEVQVIVHERGGHYTQDIKAGPHKLTADEPGSAGGADQGATPFQLLLSALGACTSITLRMYADRKEWPLKGLTVKLALAQETDAYNKRTDIIQRSIVLDGDLDAAQKARLLEIANKCPVHRLLEGKPRIDTRLEAH